VPTTLDVIPIGRTEPKAGPDQLYRRAADEYGAALERLAYAYERDADSRRDLLQEIHLQLWRSFPKFDERCSLRTWIYRVAHNTAASYVIRRTKKHRQAPAFLTLEEAAAQASNHNLETSADRQQALTRLLALIQQLNFVDRQVILAYLEDLDAESISEITGLSTANVWTKIHRIKNTLVRQFHTGEQHAR